MAIVKVQEKVGKNTSAATTLVVTFDSTPTADNSLFAIVSTPSTSSTPVTSITSTGGTWVRDITKLYTAPPLVNGGTIDIWRAFNITGTPGAAVTFNLASSMIAEAIIYEVSGLGTPSLDKTASDQSGADGGAG
jgi:hypothetical protein